MTQMDLSIKQKLTHREDRLEVAKGDGGKGKNWKSGVNRCKLLRREWINNKVLL